MKNYRIVKFRYQDDYLFEVEREETYFFFFKSWNRVTVFASQESAYNYIQGELNPSREVVQLVTA